MEKSLASVHSGSGELGWPVELGVVPLRQSLLLLVSWVVTLVRQMVLVVAQLLED